MKIILSRKGFDTANGGFPSPILPDGRMISLPIPLEDSICYSDLKVDPYGTYFDLMMNLNKKRIKSHKQWYDLTTKTKCHLDPDILRSVLPDAHKKGWKSIFGQRNSAQTHLENEGIKDERENDLFLFFGTFRQTKYHEGKLRFDRHEKPKHIIFGYLQVGKILKVNENTKCPTWMEYHPHTNERRRAAKNNTIYIANDSLSWNSKLKGAGTFLFNDGLVLTKTGYSKSRWDLDDAFRKVRISCHSNSNWMPEGYFQTNGIGQEFVVHADKNIEKWVKDLFRNSQIATA